MAPRKALMLLFRAALCIPFHQFLASAAVVSSADFSQLVAAINSSTNVQLSFDGTVQFPSPIIINKLVEIDASGRSVEFAPASPTRFFNVTTNGHLILRGITLRNGTTTNTLPGSSGFGGAIALTNGSLTLYKCALINNWARGGPASITRDPVYLSSRTVVNAGSGYGGAIAATRSRLQFLDCVFEGNGGSGPNGQYMDRDQFASVSIAYPGGSAGGAVHGVDTDVQIDRCRFKSNSSQGGTVYTGSATLHGWGSGGAISTTTIEATASTFVENVSKGSAGAIRTGKLFARDCSFTRNSIVDGLGGAVSLSTGLIDRSVFSFNSITGSAGGSENGGGAVYFYTDLQVLNSAFVSNRAVGGPWYSIPLSPIWGPGGPQPPGRGYGGALASATESASSLQITNSIFYGNSVRSGDGGEFVRPPASRGAAIATSAPANITHSTFAANYIETQAYVNLTNAPGSIISAPTNRPSIVQASLFSGSAPGPLVTGVIIDAGFNISSEATPAFTQATSLNNIDPKLQFFTNARLSIVRPASGSPAINRVTTHLADYDIRGAQRPQTGSDSGAVELDPVVPMTITATNNTFVVCVPSFAETVRLFGATDLHTSWVDVGVFTPTNGLSPLFTISATAPRWFLKLRLD